MSLKHIKDWQGEELDIFKVTDASSKGAGLTKHEWQGAKTATQEGTTINADLMNELQKSLVHSVEATLNAEGIFELAGLGEISDFKVFDGLKMLIVFKTEPPASGDIKFKLLNENYVLKGEYDRKLIKQSSQVFISVEKTSKKFIAIASYLEKLELGNEAGQALEGDYLKKLIGADFKGNLSVQGIKKNGDAYYDEQTKQIVIGTGLGDAGADITYNDITKFSPISNSSLLNDITLAHSRILRLYDKLNETVEHVKRLESSYNKYESALNLPTPQIKSGFCRAYNFGAFTVVEVELNINAGEKIPHGTYTLLENLPETFRPANEEWQIWGVQ